MTQNDPQRELARLREGTARVAETLVRVEQHPGYTLLIAETTMGTTAGRCAAERTALASAWLDYMELQAVVDAAGQASDAAEVQRLVSTASIALEAEPTDGFGFVGPTVRRVTPSDLLVDLETTLARIDDLLATCDRVQTAAFTALIDLACALRSIDQRLATFDIAISAESTAHRLLDVLEERVGRDPLAVAAGDFAADLAEVRAAIDARAAECTHLEQVRDRWPHLLADIGTDLDGISLLARQTASRQRRAHDLITGAPTPDAHHRLPDLNRRVEQLMSLVDIRQRSTGIAELRAEFDSTVADLQARGRSADELVERRDELRGRYRIYRAKARRLGMDDRAALRAAGQRARTLLWTRPCDLMASTRAVADFQHGIRTIEESS